MPLQENAPATIINLPVGKKKRLFPKGGLKLGYSLSQKSNKWFWELAREVSEVTLNIEQVQIFHSTSDLACDCLQLLGPPGQGLCCQPICQPICLP